MKHFLKNNYTIFKHNHPKSISLKFLSGNTIKIIATIAMFIDHCSKIYLNTIIEKKFTPMLEKNLISFDCFNNINNFIQTILYGIGSIAFPLFCFLLVEGFCKTKNFKKYFSLILCFAVISEIPFDIALFNKESLAQGSFPFYFKYQNVFITFTLGLIVLYGIKKLKSSSKSFFKILEQFLLQIIFVSIICLITLTVKCDYNIYGILVIICFYIFKNNIFCSVLIYILIYFLFYRHLPTIYIWISCLIMFAYNGKRGKLNLKYFFYIFYPAHLILLYLASLFIN